MQPIQRWPEDGKGLVLVQQPVMRCGVQGVPQLQQVASLPRPERSVLSEWFRAQRCAAEMLSLACGHLRIMRTSLLDAHLRPGSCSGGGSCSGAGHEASVAADSADGGSVLGEHAPSAGPPV